MRIVVTGGREFLDVEFLNMVMDRLLEEWEITEVAHGGQKEWMPLTKRWRGVDFYVDRWAESRSVPCQVFAVSEGEWRRLAKAAGPVRNRRMINEFQPDRVLAFPGNKGTKDCVTYALDQGYVVYAVVKDRDGYIDLREISDPRLF